MMTPSLHATSGARRSPAIEWVLPIGLLLLAAAKVYWLCWKAWDLPIYDDSGYLWNGWVYLHESGLPSANWSPLYAVWEGVIFYFFEPFGILAVFVAVRLAAVVLSAVVLFIWLRRNLSQTTAWLLAALFLILRGIVDMEMSTTVHQFTLVPVLLITALAGTRGTYVKGAVLGSLLLLTMLRTEYSLAFALTLAGYVAMDVRTLRADRRLRPLLWGYAPLALAAALVALMLHVAKAPENRSWIAFEQHFYWTYQERQPEKFEGKPVGAADWDTLAAEYFGDADSVLEAVIANPGAVAGHMLYNASQLPHALSVLLVPAGAPRWLELVIEALTLLTVVLALANLWRRRRDLPGWLHDHWPVVLTYGSILIVNLGSAILLMVRFNLLIPAIPLLMLLAGLLIDLAACELRLWLAEIPVEGNRLLLIGCALFLALSPAPFRFGTPECSLNSITQTLNDLVADEHARGPYQFL